jgi:hypothetical protein
MFGLGRTSCVVLRFLTFNQLEGLHYESLQ